MAFQKATKKKARLRLCLCGPGGSGKTFTALTLARTLAGDQGRVAVIDSERGSASKYADQFDFDVDDDLRSFAPEEYVKRIHAAEQAGYSVIVIDSLSHAWMGKDGALEQVDKAAARSNSKNSFTAWREVTPMHNALVDAMLNSSAHIIATLRVKTEWVMEEDEKGRKVPRKVGLAPIQRDGLEYEFDVMGDMDRDNRLVISKSRCPALSNAVIPKPGIAMANTLVGWLTDGADVVLPEKSEAEALADKLIGAMNDAGFPNDVAQGLVKGALSKRKLKEPTAEFAAEFLAALNEGKFAAFLPKEVSNV